MFRMKLEALELPGPDEDLLIHCRRSGIQSVTLVQVKNLETNPQKKMAGGRNRDLK